MSRHESRRRRSSFVSTAALAAATSAFVGQARAAITLDLRLPGGQSNQTNLLIGGDQNNTDIPIQVWATVTGSQTLNPVPVAGTSASNPQVQSGTGDYFNGLQYVYYNVLNSNATNTYISGGIDATAGHTPTLNSVLGFKANGSQAGLVANVVGGVSVGSTSKVTDVAKPRGAAGIFDDESYFNQSSALYQELGNDGQNISTSGKSASFLLETLYFKPTQYNSLNKTTFTLSIPSAAFTASAATDLSPANWFQDITSQNLGTGTPPSSTVSGGGPVSGTPTVGTSVVIQDTLLGDANLDGTVNFADLLIVAQNYNVPNRTFSTGDFNGDGQVNFADLLDVAQNYNGSVYPITPSDASLLAATGGPSFMSLWQEAQLEAVPEPSSAGLFLTVGGLASLRRRRGRDFRTC